MHHGGLNEDAITGKVYDAILLKRFLHYLLPYRIKVAGIILLLPLVALCRLSQPLLIKYAIDHAIISQKLDLLLWPAILFLLLLLAESFLTWVEMYGLQMVGQNIMSDLRSALFSHLQKLQITWFDKSSTGGLVTRITTDIESVGEMFAAGIVSVIGDALLLAGIVSIMLWMDVSLSLITFTVLPLLFYIAWLFRKNMRQAYRQVRSRLGMLNGYLSKVLNGITVVQIFGKELDENRRFAELNAACRDASKPVIMWDASLYAVVEMFSSVALALIIWYGGGQIVSGTITFGSLVAFITYIEKFFGPIRDFSAKYGVMQGAMAALERIFLILDQGQEEYAKEIKDVKEIDTAAHPCTTGSSPYIIQFRNVTFWYREEEPVLNDFNLKVAKGERVALVGESGGGKTTVAKLLGHLYQIKSGTLLIDNTDVLDFPLELLRRRIIVVQQEPLILAGTVEFNICLGDKQAEKMVRKAASVIGADRFIEQLQMSYQTMLDERGGNLSLGERQLICFARAVAFEPEILVLDESTASLDSVSEKLIREGISRLLHGRTALIIAHRLSTIMDADRIAVITKGRVVEEGTHKQLMSLNGEYHRLYCLQFDCRHSKQGSERNRRQDACATRLC